MSKNFNSYFGSILENKIVNYSNGELSWKNISDDLKLIGCFETFEEPFPYVYGTIGLQNKYGKIVYIYHYLAKMVEDYSIYWLDENEEWKYYNNHEGTTIERGILAKEIKEHKKKLKKYECFTFIDNAHFFPNID
jgi:hypothetical protein